MKDIICGRLYQVMSHDYSLTCFRSFVVCTESRPHDNSSVMVKLISNSREDWIYCIQGDSGDSSGIYSIFSSVLDNVKINEISFDKLLMLFANNIDYELHDIDVINRSIKDTQMRMDVEELR